MTAACNFIGLWHRPLTNSGTPKKTDGNVWTDERPLICGRKNSERSVWARGATENHQIKFFRLRLLKWLSG
jgi:hypothetical protein